MCKQLEAFAGALRSTVAALDPTALDAAGVERLVGVFTDIERLASAGRTLALTRAAELRAWRAGGHRNAAAWLASKTGSTIGAAIDAVKTAEALPALPATREALAQGRLSPAQAVEVAVTAAADPSSERAMLALAARASVADLRMEGRMRREAVVGDETAAERIRRGRFLRHWTDRDGAVRLDGRFAPDDGARIVAAVEARAERLATAARRSGTREHRDAHRADALLEVLDGVAGPRGLVHVRVDAAAWERGSVARGERCEIDGVGPVPVNVARRIGSEGSVKIVQTRGREVHRVAHMRRDVNATLRAALVARDPRCVVPGCDARTSLEIDHVVPRAQGGPTRLDNLARLCRFHHAQKTHHGWQLSREGDEWTWSRRPRAGPGRGG